MQRTRTSPIKLARTRKGLTQTQLADAMGVTKSAVSGWELGRELPHTNRLHRLARVLTPHLDIAKFCAHVSRAA